MYDVCATCSFAKFFIPYTRAQKNDTCSNVESYVRGYNEYVDIWEPKIDEKYELKQEPENKKNSEAVAHEDPCGDQQQPVEYLMSILLMKLLICCESYTQKYGTVLKEFFETCIQPCKCHSKGKAKKIAGLVTGLRFRAFIWKAMTVLCGQYSLHAVVLSL